MTPPPPCSRPTTRPHVRDRRAGAGLAADDLILTFYFTTIYTLARNIPPDSAPETAAAAAGEPAGTSAPQAAAAEAPAAGAGATGGGGGQGHGGAPRSMQVLEGLLALSLSALICHAATSLARAIGYPGQTLTMLTGLTVALATLAPRVLAPLVPSAEALAQVLMQVFYATIGASANVALVIKTAPVLFLFSAIALATHLGVLLLLGRALGFSRKELLIASNANIGGASRWWWWWWRKPGAPLLHLPPLAATTTTTPPTRLQGRPRWLACAPPRAGPPPSFPGCSRPRWATRLAPSSAWRWAATSCAACSCVRGRLFAATCRALGSARRLHCSLMGTPPLIITNLTAAWRARGSSAWSSRLSGVVCNAGCRE